MKARRAINTRLFGTVFNANVSDNGSKKLWLCYSCALVIDGGQPYIT